MFTVACETNTQVESKNASSQADPFNTDVPPLEENVSITDKFPGFSLLDNEVAYNTSLDNVPGTGNVYCTVCSQFLSVNSYRVFITNNYMDAVNALTLHSAFVVALDTKGEYALYRKLKTENGLTETFEFQVADDVKFDMHFITVFQDSDGNFLIYKDVLNSLSVSQVTFLTINNSLLGSIDSLSNLYLVDLL